MAQTAEDHNHVLRWAHVLEQEVLRLRKSRIDAMASSERVAASGYHRPEDNEPFHRMAGYAHFVIIASTQLANALKRFDGRLRLPTTLKRSDIDLLRNALEHWNHDTGNAQTKMASRGANPRSHQWAASGAGRIGDLIEDELLLQWAQKVYGELLHYDPPSPWASGQE